MAPWLHSEHVLPEEKLRGNMGPVLVNPNSLIEGCSSPNVMIPHQTQEHPQLRNGGQHYPSVSRTCIKCVFSCPMHGSFLLPQKYASCLTLN